MHASLLSFQKLIAQNKKLIEQVFLSFELALVGLLAAISFFYLQGSLSFVFVYELGAQLGVVSLWFYIATLIPGMLQRFKVLLPLSVAGVLLRRHLGIMMFLTAWAHSWLTTSLSQMASDTFVEPVAFQIMGIIALYLLFPLWLTSNDKSQRWLGRWWKWLHRLTYVALLFVYFHVALQLSSWRWVVLAVIGLEIASWVVYWWRQFRVRSTEV